MKIAIEERGKGKTTHLIKMSNKMSVPILTADNESRKYIKELASQIDVKILEPITMYEVKHGKIRGLNYVNNGVLVDDIDNIILTYFASYGLQIRGFSVTKTELINRNI